MKCNGCLHYEVDKCTEKTCVYIHINENDFHKDGHHIKGEFWCYHDKYYKIIGCDLSTSDLICIEVRM